MALPSVDAVDECSQYTFSQGHTIFARLGCNMQFVDECARSLDSGAATGDVMAKLRARYTTIGCLNSKLSQVRSRCTPSSDYYRAVEDALSTVSNAEVRRRVEALASTGRRLHVKDSEEVRRIVRSLPHRLPENVRGLRLSRHEMWECKRTQLAKTIEKNRTRTVVDGRTLFAHARAVVSEPSQCRGGIPELTLALMVVTGRRECELLNGRSEFLVNSEYSLVFRGQAKKRDDTDTEERLIPCLCQSSVVVACVAHLRARQGHAILTNEATSRRYQSYLSRHMRSASPWSETKTHVHSLRGIYTCMCQGLFEWGLHTDAYVAMCILGHTSLTESLVYTTFAIGRNFYPHEPLLGEGHLTPPPLPPPDPCDPTPESEPGGSSSDGLLDETTRPKDSSQTFRGVAYPIPCGSTCVRT